MAHKNKHEEEYKEPEYEQEEYTPPEGEEAGTQDALPPQTNLGPGGPWLDHNILPQPGTVEDAPPPPPEEELPLEEPASTR